MNTKTVTNFKKVIEAFKSLESGKIENIDLEKFMLENNIDPMLLDNYKTFLENNNNILEKINHLNFQQLELIEKLLEEEERKIQEKKNLEKTEKERLEFDKKITDILIKGLHTPK